MDSSASSNKSPSKMLEKLGNMLLESARALAASRNHDHTGDDHGGSLPQSSRRRHPSWSPEQLSDVTTVDDNEPSDRLLARAQKLQKSMRAHVHTKKSHPDDHDSIFLNICAMKEVKPGVYSRAKTPLIEVKARKGDDYKSVCRKAATACHLKATDTQELCLFRVNGVQILNEKITLAKKQKRWTIGHYLTAIKKSPGNVKFGIGYIKQHPADEECSFSKTISNRNMSIKDSDDQHQSNIRVLYYAPSPVAAQKCVPHKGIMRAHIWYNIKGCDTSKISDYQPEDDGYKVLSIYRDDQPILLSSDGGTFTVKNSNTATLELFTRKPPYCKDWEDPKLVEHFDDKRKTLEGYKEIYDEEAGAIPHYMVAIYHKIIEHCLLKHSRRCTSAQAMDWWTETNY